ncbi:MAG TPA: AAA family ATPase [Anaerolineae bacterium]|nr:AAA family ATPase [Anaerolineae bacterium]
MKISVSGKGGSGKTTLAGTLARSLARSGLQVLAIDGDSNPNLGLTLGLPAASLASLPDMPPGDLLVEVEGEGGRRSTELAMGIEEVAARYGSPTPDGVLLLSMKRIDHAGKG